ncbi:MAG: hypothetical protein ACRETL_18225, partial [Gammaproteobacteria bacterium]
MSTLHHKAAKRIDIGDAVTENQPDLMRFSFARPLVHKHECATELDLVIICDGADCQIWSKFTRSTRRAGTC